MQPLEVRWPSLRVPARHGEGRCSCCRTYLLFCPGRRISGSRANRRKYGDLARDASTRPAQCLGQLFGGKRLKPGQPASSSCVNAGLPVLGCDSVVWVMELFPLKLRRMRARPGNLRLVGIDTGRDDAPTRTRRPAMTRIWKDRKATSCDRVTISVVDQPASSSLCSAAGLASRGWKTSNAHARGRRRAGTRDAPCCP